jgi:hypothetical protein
MRRDRPNRVKFYKMTTEEEAGEHEGDLERWAVARAGDDPRLTEALRQLVISYRTLEELGENALTQNCVWPERVDIALPDAIPLARHVRLPPGRLLVLGQQPLSNHVRQNSTASAKT